MNIDISVVGTLNQFFTRGSYTEKNFANKKQILAELCKGFHFSENFFQS